MKPLYVVQVLVAFKWIDFTFHATSVEAENEAHIVLDDGHEQVRVIQRIDKVVLSLHVEEE